MAAGDTRPYVGETDITMMYPVVDISGLNRLSRRILTNAAGAIVGIVTRDSILQVLQAHSEMDPAAQRFMVNFTNADTTGGNTNLIYVFGVGH